MLKPTRCAQNVVKCGTAMDSYHRSRDASCMSVVITQPATVTGIEEGEFRIKGYDGPIVSVKMWL